MMLTGYFDRPIELSSPKGIQGAITEALEEERKVIAEESLTRTWSEVREILHSAAKQRFFDRLESCPQPCSDTQHSQL
jgi:hypothetical protein